MFTIQKFELDIHQNYRCYVYHSQFCLIYGMVLPTSLSLELERFLQLRPGRQRIRPSGEAARQAGTWHKDHVGSKMSLNILIFTSLVIECNEH